MVLVGRAEHLADHQRGHRQRERPHQVDRTVVTGEHLVDGLVDDLLDARLQRVDALDRELADHCAPRGGMVGAVKTDHRRLLLAETLTRVRVVVEDREVLLAPIRAEPAVIEHRSRVLVPGDPPDLLTRSRQRHLADRLLALVPVLGRHRERAAAQAREHVLGASARPRLLGYPGPARELGGVRGDPGGNSLRHCPHPQPMWNVSFRLRVHPT